MSGFEDKIQDKTNRKASLAGLLRLAATPDYEVFRKIVRGRRAEIVNALESDELSPYELGRLQGRLEELDYCVIDSFEIERESERLQSEIDRLSGRQAKRAIRELMKPVDPRRGK